MTEALQELRDYLGENLESEILSLNIAFDELNLEVQGEHILRVLKFLRDDTRCRFVSFIDICGADYPAREKRFEVVYHLLSPRRNVRIRIKVAADEVKPVPSAISVFPAAEWFEREAYDMYGILFSDHPDLRRMLTDYGFDGHPLRKDFPVTGFVETRYDEERKRVVREPVQLAQEMRLFDFTSPWEGPDYVLPGDEKASED